MHKKALSVALLAVIASAPVTAFADEHNLLGDSSFENRAQPDEGGWTLFDESVISTAQARTGVQSMYNGGLSQTTTYPPYFVGMVSGSFQEFPAEPGSQWQLVGYGMTPVKLAGAPAFGILQISFFDAEGKDIGTVETADSPTGKAKLSNEVNNQTEPGEWTLLDTGVATAPEGTASVQAFTLYVDYSGTNQSQGVFFDDLTLCEVGEDGSACESD
ncbi:MAG: hypothetical protein QNI99_05555 [Woeseiaceae bacterium]|nr:hypothetical protein [Woeseiaceae bacterium]